MVWPKRTLKRLKILRISPTATTHLVVVAIVAARVLVVVAKVGSPTCEPVEAQRLVHPLRDGRHRAREPIVLFLRLRLLLGLAGIAQLVVEQLLEGVHVDLLGLVRL